MLKKPISSALEKMPIINSKRLQFSSCKQSTSTNIRRIINTEKATKIYRSASLMIRSQKHTLLPQGKKKRYPVPLMTWNVIGKDDTRQSNQQQKLQLLKPITSPHLPSLTQTSKTRKISVTFSTSLHRNLTPKSNTETPAHPSQNSKGSPSFFLFSGEISLLSTSLSSISAGFRCSLKNITSQKKVKRKKVRKTTGFFLNHNNKS